MGRLSSALPVRPRPGRALRRPVLEAEPLEPRRLLSAAAFQPMVATGLTVSAIIGPAEASPITPIVSSAQGANMASQVQIGFGLNPVVPNAPAGSGIFQTVF